MRCESHSPGLSCRAAVVLVAADRPAAGFFRFRARASSTAG